MARNSVKIGIINLAVWIIPLLGFLLAALGFVLLAYGYSDERKDMVRAAIFLNTLGLSMSILNLVVSAYLISSGIIEPGFMFNGMN